MIEIAVLSVITLLTLIALLTTLSLILALFGWVWTGVPFVPAPKNALAAVRDALNADERSVVYDLGCGDGRVLFALAENSDARFIGVEKAPLPFFLALMRRLFSKRKNVKIILGDIYRAPLSEATHVFLYLFPALMNTLLPVFEKKLQPGARVVSCDFQFSARAPQQTIVCGSGNNIHTLYIYDF